MTTEEREALEAAKQGEWKLANEMEFAALKLRVSDGLLRPHRQDKPDEFEFGVYDLSEFELEGYYPRGTRMTALDWCVKGYCANCEGIGTVTVCGRKRDAEVDCPDCDGEGVSVSVEIRTDLEGNILQ
jgi:hypothetical protein